MGHCRGTMRNLLALPTIGGGGVENFQHHHLYHHQSNATALSTSGTPCTVAELSEPEYDLDTLKKLKLGLRSSLWSRPNANTNKSNNSNELNANNQMRHAVEATSNPTDYSIAVWMHWINPFHTRQQQKQQQEFGFIGSWVSDRAKKVIVTNRTGLFKFFFKESVPIFEKKKTILSQILTTNIPKI